VSGLVKQMPFQFLCPQGHLLQGEDSQMGLQTQCPICSVVFVIPQVVKVQVAPVQPLLEPEHASSELGLADLEEPASRTTAAKPAVTSTASTNAQSAAQRPGPAIPPATARRPARPQSAAPHQAWSDPQPALEQELSPLAADLSEELVGQNIPLPPGDLASSVVHIPCPNGHELETPLDMIGEQVMCPHCRARFVLREEDSVEYRIREENLEQRRARFWLTWAITAAVLVGIFMLTMFIMAMRS
jgi:hypothetical protein